MNGIGNYKQHAGFWDWSGYDNTEEYEYWYRYAARYGENVLIPMCAWGTAGAYMAERELCVTAFDITPEMVDEGRKRFGGLKGFQIFESDIRKFCFNITPVDFCFCSDFGHLHTLTDVKRALVSINNHMRDGGALVIETGLRSGYSDFTPEQIFYPKKQVYPGLKVWKTGTTRNDGATGRCYISQDFFYEDNNGNIESFKHEFYLQSYTREEWLEAFLECGFEVAGEYTDRRGTVWQSGSEKFRVFEALKSVKNKRRYSPVMTFENLRTPVYRYENVALYNDYINLQQPNDGNTQGYKFSINADGRWVGWIYVKTGYTINAYYDGQIGYMIDNPEDYNHGYMTKACLALKPFLRYCGYRNVLITTDEKNSASRRVCEKIGAALTEIVDTPEWTGIYERGQRRTCIYEWNIIENYKSSVISALGLRFDKIDLAADRDYILERHSRVNYECDCPWARDISYKEYRQSWFENKVQVEGFLRELTESMNDVRTLAFIIRDSDGNAAAYLWVPFHSKDESFIFAEVQDIYVEEDYRRSGLAFELMKYAEKTAEKHGAKVIRSGTGFENVKSQSLHKKLGYYEYRHEYEKVLK